MEYLKNIIITSNIPEVLKNIIDIKNYTRYVFLVDDNTASLCLPLLLKKWPLDAKPDIIKIPAGEKHKTLARCRVIWRKLTGLRADRHTLLINLGGGVVCDMGGFCAATYKRGIAFINIPTTLLAMVDAAIGGKTGVDLGVFKNQVGLFAFPEAVLINPVFLNSLPKNELKNGYAEIIKHALIRNENLWNSLMNEGFDNLARLIETSVAIKLAVVESDPFEKNERKLLNFGHTVGHAVEMLSPQIAGRQLSHGEAIAEGIISESYISTKIAGLSLAEADKIKGFVRRFFPPVTFTKGNTEAVYELMLHDKKNRGGKIKMTLLKGIGEGIYDVEVPLTLIMECLKETLSEY